MNKMKKGLLVGLTVFIIGAVMFTAGMSVLDWDFYKLDTVKYTERTFLASESGSETEITRAEISVSSFGLEIARGDEIKLDYYEASDSVVSVGVENGVFKLNERHKSGCFVYGMFKLGRLKYKYKLTLPDGVELSINSANGDLSLYGVNAANLKITSANCDLSLSDCGVGPLFVDATNADINVTNSACGRTEINSTNLDVFVKNSNFESFTVSGTNLDVEMYGATAADASFAATNADLRLENLKAERVNVDGTNLDAYILIDGVKSEYTVDAHGWGDLPANQTGTDAGKKITLRGTNIDADLRFTVS